MPRTKDYIEEEVIEKAMNLFWKNGYQATSMQMLEKEMGINKFSIYSSFGSKKGVFINSLNCYKQKLNRLTNTLIQANNGVQAIKDYFYNFIEFSKENEIAKGCLITNTTNEIGNDADEQIKNTLTKFTEDVRTSFIGALQQDSTKDAATIEEQADYLIISIFGLSAATRVFNSKQLDHYITTIFKSI